MNWITIGIGVLALGFGVYSTFVRFTNPQKFRKLEAMKQKFGAKVGVFIHTIAYSAIPAVAGIIFIIQGIRGVSLF
jgi:hypothetical protein